MYFLINFIILCWNSLSYILRISWNQKIHWWFWFHGFDLVYCHLNFFRVFLDSFHNRISRRHKWTYSLAKLSFVCNLRLNLFFLLNFKIKDVLSFTKYAFLSTFSLIRHNVQIYRCLFIYTQSSNNIPFRTCLWSTH